MVYNVTSYILHSHHFPFLATLNRPFGIYCLNNSLIPLSFLITYSIQLFIFQKSEGLVTSSNTLLHYSGLIIGMVIFIVLSMLYFFSTNKNIFQILGLKEKTVPAKFDIEGPLWAETSGHADIEVATYLNHRLLPKATRPVGHYPAQIIFQVYKQHHLNALFIQLTSLFLIVLLGHLMDYPLFRIPAASSILLLFSFVLMLVGAISYWLKGWKVLASILGILLIDLLIAQNLLQYKNRPYGITYSSKDAIYSPAQLEILSSEENINNDIVEMEQILNNWRSKFPSNEKAPKMVFINCSGGGLRATMFVLDALQHADSISQGNLMDHTVLMTGASGGMIAAAYYRELLLQHQTDSTINLYGVEHLEKLSSDLLNPIAYSMVVNDLFFPWKGFTYNNINYRKDRGYMFELALNENTDNLLDKPLRSYAEAEQEMSIPLMLFYPTIINDERKLYIGNQKYSFLCYPENRRSHQSSPEIDGVDIHHLLSDKDIGAIRMTSIIRMSCTFPYILPNVYLPTTPEIEVMDAGIRDNYGIEASVRYADTFSEWIKENTSGVVMLNIRGLEQVREIRTNVSQGVLEKVFSPIGNLYLNWVEVQDYQNDFLLHHLDKTLDAPLDVITVDYRPPVGTRRASLSFHLTAKEKQDIRYAASDPYNLSAYRKLAKMLE